MSASFPFFCRCIGNQSKDYVALGPKRKDWPQKASARSRQHRGTQRRDLAHHSHFRAERWQARTAGHASASSHRLRGKSLRAAGLSGVRVLWERFCGTRRLLKRGEENQEGAVLLLQTASRCSGGSYRLGWLFWGRLSPKLRWFSGTLRSTGACPSVRIR